MRGVRASASTVAGSRPGSAYRRVVSGTSTGTPPAARTTPTDSGQYGAVDDDLVARIEDGAQAAEDGVRGPRADEHVPRRVHVVRPDAGASQARREHLLQPVEPRQRAVAVERDVVRRPARSAEARALGRLDAGVADVQGHQVASAAPWASMRAARSAKTLARISCAVRDSSVTRRVKQEDQKIRKGFALPFLIFRAFCFTSRQRLT